MGLILGFFGLWVWAKVILGCGGRPPIDCGVRVYGAVRIYVIFDGRGAERAILLYGWGVCMYYYIKWLYWAYFWKTANTLRFGYIYLAWFYTPKKIFLKKICLF